MNERILKCAALCGIRIYDDSAERIKTAYQYFSPHAAYVSIAIETANNSCHILSKIFGQYEILSPCWDDAVHEREKVAVL